jgi:hypothetical protein
MIDSDEPMKTVAILILQSNATSVSTDKWNRVAELLSSRLHHPVAWVNWNDAISDEIGLQTSMDWYATQGYHRFVLIPLGTEPFPLACLWTVMTWMRIAGRSVHIHVANAWTIEDWADAILPAVVESQQRMQDVPLSDREPPRLKVLLISQEPGLKDEIGLELSALVYHFQQSQYSLDAAYCFVEKGNPPLSAELHRLNRDTDHSFVMVHWRMDIGQIASLFTEVASMLDSQFVSESSGFAWKWTRLAGHQQTSMEPIEILEHPSWIHIVLGRYLEALATRSVERYFATFPRNPSSSEVALSSRLIELDQRIDAMLPSEYQGKEEELKLQSMGSASIPSDRFGQVPWDEIWTSFCDLAMAGGPPHRGRLLEPVSAEDVRKDPAAYERVVQEIRRGIEMVTGLKTERGDNLGWVGIQCDDEQMCTWLMRAILVENVMVRREGKVLFLPAGPEFKVKKEIKNVITSLAKTVHYWRAHLRLK